MNNPSNDRSYWWRISSNDDDEGDFINKGALDSNQGIIYQNAGTGKIRAYHNWDNFAPGSQGSNKDTYLIENLGSNITALTASPFETHERKDLQLPPNPYNERLWELTMDPVLGRPRSENIYQII